MTKTKTKKTKQTNKQRITFQPPIQRLLSLGGLVELMQLEYDRLWPLLST